MDARRNEPVTMELKQMDEGEEFKIAN